MNPDQPAATGVPGDAKGQAGLHGPFTHASRLAACIPDDAVALLEDAAGQREDAAGVRENAAGLRADGSRRREAAQRVVGQSQMRDRDDSANLREANAHLVMATLRADELTEAAETTQRRQDEFLAMLAHELRNPLAPIRSAAVLLGRLDACRNPELASIVEVIERQARHMTHLLDDLLDVSRVTTGKVNLQRRATTVREFVAHAVETSRELIDSQQQVLRVDLPANPVFVDGDPVRLAQVVGNLLHNASKYTQAGGAITVTARSQGDTVVIQVRDNGSGIAADALPHIFELFSQEARSLSRSQGGLGIGLTVVRNMVELHGGQVTVQSGGLGKGSEFTVTLPQVAAPAVQPAAAPVVPRRTPARILLVDDNLDAGDMLAVLLRMSGHAVAVAVDGPAALESFERERPQVVLCDIGLPGMDGYAVAARMRELAVEPRAVLMALTGYDGPEQRERSFAAGFDHHLSKPVDFHTLEALIAAAGPFDA